MLKLVSITVAAMVVAFGAVTWWALESLSVAVIETRTPAGDIRSTHVWYAEPDGGLWLEAGTPENAWFKDVQRDPALIFTAKGRVTRYIARAIDGDAAHARIRSLMREKYGFRDVWVGLIADTSQSVAVQLVSAER